MTWKIRFSLVCIFTLTNNSAHAQMQDTVTNFTYDGMGNVTTVVRPLGRMTTYTYDALGRVRQQITSLETGSLVETQGYDSLDQVASVTDPRMLVTNYTIDGLGNQSQLNSPDTALTSYTTDEAGNLSSITDARRKTTRFQYDALGRLIQAQYQSGIASQFEYDGGPGGPVAEIGNLTRVTDESGSTAFSHDLKGRVLTKVQTVSAGGANARFTVQYSFGTSGASAGKLVSITYPSGARVNYRYDENGLLGSVTLNQADGTGNASALSEVPLLTNITYTPTGAVKSWTWGGGPSHPYQRNYDLNGRMVSYPVDLLGTVRTVSYNAASLITEYKHAGGPNPAQYDQSFNYDTADRLISFTLGGVSTMYTYDANGNRTVQTGPNVTYTYGSTSNRLNSASFQTPHTYSYDAAGNRTGDGLRTYLYSDRGRLAQVRGSAMLDMFYNGLGQRVLKVSMAGPTYYVYDEYGRTIGQYGQNNSSMIETVYLGEQPIAVLGVQGYFYVFADQINTPLTLAHPDGTTIWDWRNHDPFGNNAPVASSILERYDHRFQGQIADIETGLFYNYYRDYDPQTARYIQSDPIGLDGGVNTYSYVQANPVSRTDRLGLQAVLPVTPPPVLTPPGRPGYGEPGDFKGPQYFWPKVVRDAASSIVDACTGGGGDRCNELNEQVKAAKDGVGQYSPAACRSGMSRWDLLRRRKAWLDLASARSHRDQKCWEGGDSGHQQAQASAWEHVGNCDNLLTK